MTRLTNDLRDDIFSRIMEGLPNRDFVVEICTLVQEVVMAHAPKQVQELYANEATREYVAQNYVEVRQGNRSVPLYRDGRREYVCGLKDRMTVRMDDAEHSQRLSDGSLYKTLVTKLHESKLVTGYFEQEELRETVRKRLKANLAAANTIKRLYDVLEPELHGFIPRETATGKLLPATVAPVVDDLKKLGLVVPDVLKSPAPAA